MKALLVTKKDNFFQIPGPAKPVIFENLKPEMKTIYNIEPLTGWGQWSHIIHFANFDGQERWYFLEGDPF